jgi:hypothetical protein
MSHLIELAGQCAVTCAKSDNMRVTASKIAHEAVEYLKTDAGIMEAIAAGVEPNTAGFHNLVTNVTRTEVDGSKTRLLPGKSEFWSLRSFQRLLQIAGDPDKDAELRRSQSAADKARRRASKSTASTAVDIEDVLSPAPASGANCNSAELLKEALASSIRRPEPPVNDPALPIIQRPIFKEFLSLMGRMLPEERAYAHRFLKANVEQEAA